MKEILINGAVSLCIAIGTGVITYLKTKKECESNYKTEIDKIIEQNKGNINKLKEEIQGQIKVYEENKKMDVSADLFLKAMENKNMSNMLIDLLGREFEKKSKLIK